MANNFQKKLYTSKVKHTIKQWESREIVINRNEYSHMLSFYANYVKEHSTTQSMNTIEYRTVSENLSKGNIIYRREITNDKYRQNIAYINLKQHITRKLCTLYRRIPYG